MPVPPIRSKPETRCPAAALRADRRLLLLARTARSTELYGWGQPGFHATMLLERLADAPERRGPAVARVRRSPARRRSQAIELFIASLAGTPPASTRPASTSSSSLQHRRRVRVRAADRARARAVDRRQRQRRRGDAACGCSRPPTLTLVPPTAAPCRAKSARPRPRAGAARSGGRADRRGRRQPAGGAAHQPRSQGAVHLELRPPAKPPATSASRGASRAASW